MKSQIIFIGFLDKLLLHAKLNLAAAQLSIVIENLLGDLVQLF